ncbi:DUF2771 domain-containing protein [Corynebacterium uterequi]|uniref:Putative DUF2771 family protein n=1 Tax=Corynebacterium uterequi TaxID=1072256 RepID=A0A0G3HBL3_9CORY|nr:DUF2771 domain-containing protein [Corynebacterium uterequi]AKK10644.1 putative DUF2771 family protein [Corynebacterium uterequi]
MATRNEAKKKSLLQLLTLVIVATLVVAAVVLGQWWLRQRPDPLPEDTVVTVSVGDGDGHEVRPYLLATPGVLPVETTPAVIEVGPEDTVTIDLPEHVYDHDWSAVVIYDNPAFNDEIHHGPNDARSLSVVAAKSPLQAGEQPGRLVVVEIQSVLIGQDADGEETPVTTVWSVATQHAQAAG